MTEPTVRKNEALDRYELTVDGHTAVAAYRRSDGVVTFTHTSVPSELEGRGVGSRLIAGALENVRRDRLKIVPQCPFVAKYVEDHPDVQDLVAAS